MTPRPKADKFDNLKGKFNKEQMDELLKKIME